VHRRRRAQRTPVEHAARAATALAPTRLERSRSRFTTPALDVVAALIREERTVGAGTVTSVAQYRNAVAGRRAASWWPPTLDVAVVGQRERTACWPSPGRRTPTETWPRARRPARQVFPASLWSPRSPRDVLTRMPRPALSPTGGIRLDEVPARGGGTGRRRRLGSRLSR
jgi:2-keto-3-deoxy-6-phosphogluconate aldolase